MLWRKQENGVKFDIVMHLTYMANQLCLNKKEIDEAHTTRLVTGNIFKNR